MPQLSNIKVSLNTFSYTINCKTGVYDTLEITEKEGWLYEPISSLTPTKANKKYVDWQFLISDSNRVLLQNSFKLHAK